MFYNQRERSKRFQATAMSLGMLLVAGGAWTIFHSFARSVSPTVTAQKRVLVSTTSAPGVVARHPSTVLATPTDGTVSLVLAEPGLIVDGNQPLIEFDREPTIQELVVALTTSLNTQRESLTPEQTRSRYDELAKLQKKAQTLVQNEKKQMDQLRATVVDYHGRLEVQAKEIRVHSATIEQSQSTTSVSPEDTARLQDTLVLIQSVLEGDLLSQRLTLSDLEVFFGADGTSSNSSFIKALKSPQDAVPFWEKVLEAKRLHALLTQRFKEGSRLSDSQEAGQLILTSRSITEMTMDILNGLKNLLAAIEPSDIFPPAEVQAHERLLARNGASMETILESLKVHEQRLLSQAEEIKTKEATIHLNSEKERSALAQAYQERSRLFDALTKSLIDHERQLTTIRSDRSRALEALSLVQSGFISTASDPGLSTVRSVDTVRSHLSALTVNANSGGVVEEVLVRVGDVVHKGDQIVRLSTSSPTIEAQFAIKDVERIAVGQKLEVVTTSSTQGVVVLSGRIAQWNAGLDAKHSTAIIQLNSGSDLLDSTAKDLSVTVNVKSATPSAVVSIPIASLRPGSTIVMRDRATQSDSAPRWVATGMRSDDGFVEVLSGLAGGDQVVLP